MMPSGITLLTSTASSGSKMNSESYSPPLPVQMDARLLRTLCFVSETDRCIDRLVMRPPQSTSPTSHIIALYTRCKRAILVQLDSHSLPHGPQISDLVSTLLTILYIQVQLKRFNCCPVLMPGTW